MRVTAIHRTAMKRTATTRMPTRRSGRTATTPIRGNCAMTILELLEQKVRGSTQLEAKVDWIRRSLPRDVTLHRAEDGSFFLQKKGVRLDGVDIVLLEEEILAARNLAARKASV